MAKRRGGYRMWAERDYGRCPLEWDLRQAKRRLERALAVGAPTPIASARNCVAELEAAIAAWEAPCGSAPEVAR